MSEEGPRRIARLEMGKWQLKATPSKTFQCTATVTFETATKRDAELVVARLTSMQIYSGSSLVDEAVDVLQDDVEKIKEAGEILKRKHKEEIATLLQTTSLQTVELNRLKKLEEGLERIAGLSIPKVIR